MGLSKKDVGFANMLTFAFMHHPYLVYILCGMPFLHLFTFFNFITGNSADTFIHVCMGFTHSGDLSGYITYALRTIRKHAGIESCVLQTLTTGYGHIP